MAHMASMVSGTEQTVRKPSQGENAAGSSGIRDKPGTPAVGLA